MGSEMCIRDRVNHTMAQMLAMAVNERQDDWDLRHPHVEFAYNNSVTAATGLELNEVHTGRLPRLLLTVFERTGVAGHPRLAHDHLAYFDFATNRQHSVDCTVRKHHASPFLGLITETPPSPTRCVRHLNLAWVVGHGYKNPASTVRQGVKANMDAEVVKAKRAVNWTGPYKVRAVDPCSSADTLDSSPLGENLLYLDLPSDLPGSDSRRLWGDRTLLALCQPP